MSGGIHLLDRREKDQIDGMGAAKLQIVLDGTRIFREILARTELRGIDENGHRDSLRVFTAQLDEPEMTFMQGPHRRHQRHAADEPAAACRGIRKWFWR